MAINFPNNPIQGNTYTYLGVEYKWQEAGSSGFWKTITAANGPATSSEIDAGINTVKYATPNSLEDSKYNDALNYLVPSGLISLWHGSLVSVPTGWVLCNGLNGTPDLSGRFVLGAGGSYAVGDVGGSADAVAVAHGHTAGSTGAAGAHSHSGATVAEGAHTHSGTAASAGYHNHSGTANSAGGHSHTVGAYANGPKKIPNNSSVNRTATGTGNTSTAGAHSHTLSINSNGTHAHTVSVVSAGSHNHGVTVSTAPNHSHSVTVNNAGSSGVNKNLPPYYVLAYIMKT